MLRYINLICNTIIITCLHNTFKHFHSLLSMLCDKIIRELHISLPSVGDVLFVRPFAKDFCLLQFLENVDIQQRGQCCHQPPGGRNTTTIKRTMFNLHLSRSSSIAGIARSSSKYQSRGWYLVRWKQFCRCSRTICLERRSRPPEGIFSRSDLWCWWTETWS